MPNKARRVGKLLGFSPDGNTKDKIDFVMSNKKEIAHELRNLNKFCIESDHRMLRKIINKKWPSTKMADRTKNIMKKRRG